ncbi:MAG: hypothetical protein U9O94_01425 [Nanoarchaeota archaeon]|nr:hypothetical protein [Nanoarchaeota archaeon]
MKEIKASFSIILSLLLLVFSLNCLFFFIENCYGAAEDMYVTVAGAGGKSGVNWDDAMDWSAFKTDFEANAETGDRYFLAGGNYTLGSNLTDTGAGSASEPIEMIGVKSGTTAEPPTQSDWAYGTDRPYFDIQSYKVDLDGQHKLIRNFRMSDEGAAAYVGMAIGRGSMGVNVKVETVRASSEGAIQMERESTCINCEAVNTGGAAFLVRADTFVVNSYAHDSATCYALWGANAVKTVINSVADTCTIGFSVDVSSYDQNLIIGNTIYNSTTGISLGTIATSGEEGYAAIYSNLIDNCTTGITVSNEAGLVLLDYNMFSNNTTDHTADYIHPGVNVVFADVTMTDPANKDFTLPDSSSAEDAGMQLSTDIGVVGDYNVNIGVDQTDTQSGGAATTSYGFSN